MTKFKQLKESYFYLTTPLEHIDFHIIGYQMLSTWSVLHYTLDETHCHHIDILYIDSHIDNLAPYLSNKQQGLSYICTFAETGQHIPQPLMDQLRSTG